MPDEIREHVFLLVLSALAVCDFVSLLKVSAKDHLVPGDTLFLPVNIQESPVAEKARKFDNRNEIDFLRSLEIYKVLIYSCI